jgi:hypothetical protein
MIPENEIASCIAVMRNERVNIEEIATRYQAHTLTIKQQLDSYYGINNIVNSFDSGIGLNSFGDRIREDGEKS